MAITRNTTAKISCITSTPIASLPWRVLDSPASSRTFTTHTVLLKDSANAISAALCQSKVPKLAAARLPTNIKTAPTTTTHNKVCAILPNQTSRFDKSLILSFRPMVNSIMVMPRLASVVISGVVEYPKACSKNPAAR